MPDDLKKFRLLTIAGMHVSDTEEDQDLASIFRNIEFLSLLISFSKSVSIHKKFAKTDKKPSKLLSENKICQRKTPSINTLSFNWNFFNKLTTIAG